MVFCLVYHCLNFRLVIKRTTKSPGVNLETGLDEQEELFSFSLSEALMSNMDSEPSPFQSTSVAYGSKLKSQNDSMEKEETANKSINHDEVPFVSYFLNELPPFCNLKLPLFEFYSFNFHNT